jgi:hypothetical protein
MFIGNSRIHLSPENLKPFRSARVREKLYAVARILFPITDPLCTANLKMGLVINVLDIYRSDDLYLRQSPSASEVRPIDCSYSDGRMSAGWRTKDKALSGEGTSHVSTE